MPKPRRRQPTLPPRISRRSFVRGGVAAILAAPALDPSFGAGEVLTPEIFGAKGDGRTNDTLAFHRLSQRVNAQGGGTIVLRKTVYLVGLQVLDRSPGAAFGFAPTPIFHFEQCARAVTIQGNGATLRCASGLRYGTFDLGSGEIVRHKMPYFVTADRATPYAYMISAVGCAGAITIADLELDGNLPTMRIGGPYGDTGHQITGSGIYLRDNRGDEILRNIHSHHHPQDGLIIDGLDDPALAKRVARRIENFRSEYNGRQGCSIVGGAGYAFSRCRFNHTGRAGLSSAPGGGVDIEAEGGKRNVNLSFADCEFVDNSGCGMVADSGPSEGATFTRCRFVGTTSWSVWPNKPRFAFRSCVFVGALCRTLEDAAPGDATTFTDCTFLDDPAKSPTGKVYLGPGPGGPIADLNERGNPVFSSCRFLLTHNAQLPWSLHATYRDCVMSQVSPRQAYPRGIFEGRNTIRGNVDLYGSQVRGPLSVTKP